MRLRSLALATLVGLSACSDAAAPSIVDDDAGRPAGDAGTAPEDTDGGADAAPQPSALGLAATAKIALQLGASGKIELTVTRTRAGSPVRLVAKGVPGDATIAPVELPAGVSTGTLDVVTNGNGLGGRTTLELVATTRGDDGKDLEAKATVELTLSGLPGVLDKTFGGGTGTVPSPSGRVLSLAVQPDGRLVAVGETWIARWMPDGTPDATFGDQGKRTLPATGNAVALQADGKAVVAGRVFETGYPIFAARYDGSGTLDPMFGTAGVEKTELGGNDSASHVAVDAAGRALVTGFTGGVNSGFQIVRYTTAGKPDGGWGSGGIATHGGGGSPARRVVPLAAGGAVVAGTAGVFGATKSIAVMRLTSGGGLDGTFSAAYRTGFGNALAVRPDGRILVAGPTSGTPTDLQLVRFESGGGLDGTFGTAGAVVEDLGNTGDAVSDMTLQADGKILVVGRGGIPSGGGTQDVSTIVRYTADGKRDASFGTNGRVDVPGGGSGALFEAVVVQPDGKIVAAGSVGLVRFWP